MNDDQHTRDPNLADAELVTRTRSGDAEAFGELWRRHYRSGLAVAQSITSSLDSDDLVQEAYTRIFTSIQRGGGPTGSFRAYLFTSIRNTAAGWGRARRETAIDELEHVADPAASEHASDEALDRGLTHQAFRSLPTRWQEVLWYTEIEQMKPSDIAPLLGMKPTAVAQLAFRAREGLREAWIQAHLRSVSDDSACHWTIHRLGAYARRNLGKRDMAKLQLHLTECARCTIVASEAKDVSSRLALILLPLLVGAAAATSYLATVQGRDAPLVALAMAATPSSGALGGAGALGVTGGATTGGAAVMTSATTAVGALSSVSGVVAAVTLTVAAVGVGAALTSAPAPAEATEAAVIAPADVPTTTFEPFPAHENPPAPLPSDVGSLLDPTPTPLVSPAPALPRQMPVDSAAPSPSATPRTPSTPRTESPSTPTPAPKPKPKPTSSPSPSAKPSPKPSPKPSEESPATPALPSGSPSFGGRTLNEYVVNGIRFLDYTFTITGKAGAAVVLWIEGDGHGASGVIRSNGTLSLTATPAISELNSGFQASVAYSSDAGMGPAQVTYVPPAR